MPKTIKQISDELGIDKQRVYRFIKRNHISESHQQNGVMYYDESTEIVIKQYFSKIPYSYQDEVHQKHINEVVSDTVNNELISLLKTELDIKNKQIDELNNRLAELTTSLTSAQQMITQNQQLIANEQLLHAGTIQHKLTCDDTTKPRFKERLKFLFKGEL